MDGWELEQASLATPSWWLVVPRARLSRTLMASCLSHAIVKSLVFVPTNLVFTSSRARFMLFSPLSCVRELEAQLSALFRLKVKQAVRPVSAVRTQL